MSDEHRTPLDIIADQICELLPETLRNDEKFVYHFGQFCGYAAGWFVGKKIVDLLFPKGDKK